MIARAKGRVRAQASYGNITVLSLLKRQEPRIGLKNISSFLLHHSQFCFLSFQLAYYYTISTKTGNKFQAGTDGKVFIRLTGDRGSTDKIPLTSNLPAGTRHFKTGQ